PWPAARRAAQVTLPRGRSMLRRDKPCASAQPYKGEVMAGYVVPPGGGRSFGPGISVKVEPGASPSFAVMESVIPPFWPGPGLHLHRAYDEAVYVLDGTVTFTLDGVEHTCPAGSCVFMPRGVSHGFANPSAAPARILPRSDTRCPPPGRSTLPTGTGRTSRS